MLESQDTFDHDKGQKSAISGLHLHWIFEFSPVDSLRIIWGFFLPQKLFIFSEVIFKDPPKRPFKQA